MYILSNIFDFYILGKSIGFVTTTRVTHATPASLYAQAASRGWEGDHYTNGLVGGCKDIAAQLVDDYKTAQVSQGNTWYQKLCCTPIQPAGGGKATIIQGLVGGCKDIAAQLVDDYKTQR